MASTITDKGMQAEPTAVDQWLTQPFKRGAGVFVGRITPAGERLFYFRYTDPEGRRPFLPIGPYHPKGTNGLKLAAAYRRAAELSVLYQSGVTDLRGHFERARAAEEAARLAAETEQRRTLAAAEQAELAAQRRMTVARLFEQWQRAELAPQVLADGTRTGRKDGGEWVRLSFTRRVFPKLGAIAAEEVRRPDLLAIVDEAKGGGTVRTAQVLFTDLRQMFRFAVEREIVPVNPLDGLRRAKIGGKPTERTRALIDGELQALARALPTARMSQRSVAAVWLILATGVRVGECMGAVWAADGLNLQALAQVADEAGAKFGVVDLAARTWHLPTTKNERAHTIHLSDFALARLAELASLRELDDVGKPVPWVFPATDHARPVCIKSFGKQLADRQREPEQRMSGRSMATQALALPGGKWTAHDLRRTAATIMARLGVSTDVIDECLNHKLQSKVARVYIHDRREAEQARAFDMLGARLAVLATGVPVSNVVALRAA